MAENHDPAHLTVEDLCMVVHHAEKKTYELRFNLLDQGLTVNSRTSARAVRRKDTVSLDEVLTDGTYLMPPRDKNSTCC